MAASRPAARISFTRSSSSSLDAFSFSSISVTRIGFVERLISFLAPDVAVGQAADLVGVLDGDVARPYPLLHFGGQHQQAEPLADVALGPPHPPGDLALGPARLDQQGEPACLVNRVEVLAHQVLYQGGNEPLVVAGNLSHEGRYLAQAGLVGGGHPPVARHQHPPTVAVRAVAADRDRGEDPHFPHRLDEGVEVSEAGTHVVSPVQVPNVDHQYHALLFCHDAPPSGPFYIECNTDL